MFPRVLVVTDRSEESDALVSCIQGLRDLGTEKVVLLYCFRLPEVSGLIRSVEELVRPALEKQQASLQTQGLEADIQLAAGAPLETISRVAQEHDASLIVLDEHPHGMLGEAFFGFQATAVSRQAVRPVLIVRFRPCGDVCAACEGTFPCRPLEHVLFPTDFSDNAEQAFEVVEQMVRTVRPRVTLVHVQDRTRIAKYLEHKLEEFNTIDRGRLERLRDRLLSLGAPRVDIELPYGSPTLEILQRARASDVSVVVMGSQGRGFLGEVFFGSVSHNVARRAPTSVLLVPALR
jgi:nucleotide-binding universal stress UspA family protein